MRLAAVLVVTAVSCVLLAGCGGSKEDATPPAASPGADETLEELWRAPGDDVAVVAGTAHHEPGDVRVSFLVVDAEGEPVVLPTARVWVARGLDQKPFLESTAKLERIGVPGGEEADATHIYVAHLDLREPGTYWFLAEPEGGQAVQALGNVVVGADAIPSVGDAAPASKTPTAVSVRGDLAKLSTSATPGEALYEHSVAESLRARVPFVVTFATPRYCQSRTCGPVVDVLQEVSRRFQDEDVRFVHVEVFEDNDPAKGYNRWMKEWNLTTEPWTFVVGRDGTVVRRYEGVVSVNELEEALRRELGA